MTEIYIFGHNKMFKIVMGLIDKINKNNQEKLIKEIPKNDIEDIIYKSNWEIQQALLSLRDNK